MTAELIVNVTSSETRVALLENGMLAELHIERESDKGIAGNIYKGRVQRVLPGMQAAFVEIGLARSAFLYVDDVYTDNKEFESMFTVFKDEQEEVEVGEGPSVREHAPSPPIEDMLSDGREIMVQVIKEPLGTKGARISSYISLPGRYLVYLPTIAHISISRRITDENERSRLKEIVQRIKPARQRLYHPHGKRGRYGGGACLGYGLSHQALGQYSDPHENSADADDAARRPEHRPARHTGPLQQKRKKARCRLPGNLCEHHPLHRNLHAAAEIFR